MSDNGFLTDCWLAVAAGDSAGCATRAGWGTPIAGTADWEATGLGWKLAGAGDLNLIGWAGAMGVEWGTGLLVGGCKLADGNVLANSLAYAAASKDYCLMLTLWLSSNPLVNYKYAAKEGNGQQAL